MRNGATPYNIPGLERKQIVHSLHKETAYRIYSKYTDTSTLNHTCSKNWTSPLYNPMLCLKLAGWVANSVDPDETLRSLEQRRADARLCMLYKITYGTVAIQMPSYFKQSTEATHHSLRHPLAYPCIVRSIPRLSTISTPFSRWLLYNGIHCRLQQSCCWHWHSSAWQSGLLTTTYHITTDLFLTWF